MEEEADDRDSRESFLCSNFGLARSSKIKNSNDFNEEPDDRQGDHKSKEETAQNLSFDGHDSRSSRSNPDSDLNHLSALASLDPNSKFGENVSLIKDIRMAANAVAEEEVNKVYMCHLCDFKTAYANSLMNHQAVHSDFRPWVCTACEYAAKRKQDLKKHLHTVHGMMVESPMLKPLVQGGPMMKFQGNMDGIKVEQYGDVANLKRDSPSDQECPPGQPSSPPPAFLSSKRMKDENMSAFATSFPSGLSSHRINAEPDDRELESPDDNLPISFPGLSSSSSARTSNEHQKSDSSPLPKYLPGKEEGELVFNGAHPHFSWHLNKRDRFSDSSSVNIPRDWASLPIKKEIAHQAAFGLVDGNNPHNVHAINKGPSFDQRESSLRHSFSLSDDDTNVSKDRIATMETDRSITSSSVVGQGRSTQTPSGFLCEHCDILFFQRAMFVMHIGLHAPDNPWRCAVCGQTFSEKYSFTSHFINQH